MDESVTAAEPITIIYSEFEGDGEKGLFSARQAVAKIGSLDTSALSENLTAFCRRIGEVLKPASQVGSSFELASFEVTLDVSARGEVRLIGSASSEVRGGVKMVFTRIGQNGNSR